MLYCSHLLKSFKFIFFLINVHTAPHIDRKTQIFWHFCRFIKKEKLKYHMVLSIQTLCCDTHIFNSGAVHFFLSSLRWFYTFIWVQLCLIILIGLDKESHTPVYWRFSTAWYGTVWFGTARYGTAQFGSVAFPPQFSTAIEWAGLFTRRYNYSRVVIIAPPLLPWHHRKRATNKLTTKKGDGIVFFTLGMWMFLTAMERSMRMLGIYPQQQRLWWQWHGL